MHTGLDLSQLEERKAYVEKWRCTAGVLVVCLYALESLGGATKETHGVPLVAVLPIMP